MKTARPQIHIWLLPAFLVLIALTSGLLHPHRLLAASFFSSDERAATNVTQHAELPPDIKVLEVDNRFGFVHITAKENGPYDWTWEMTVKARTDALAKKGAESARCLARTNGGRLQITVTLPDTSALNRVSYRSDLEIRVPKSVAVRSKNGFGETTIAGVDGEVGATSEHGSVEIRDARDKVNAQTSFATLTVVNSGPANLKNQFGSIAAKNIRGPLEAETSFASLKATDIGGPVRLRNQHGSIETSRVKGKADLKTSFATLHAEDIEGDATLDNEHGSVEARSVAGSVKAKTSFATLKITGASTAFDCQNQHGSIELQATSASLMTVEARTSFGSLEVRLPDDFAPAIHAQTSFSQVESDFPVLLKPRGQDPFADVPSGTPRIKLQNEHGSIRVARTTRSASR